MSTDDYLSTDGKSELPADRQSQSIEEVSFRLSHEASAALKEIVKLGAMGTIQEAIRRAIGDELFLLQERTNGWNVMLKKGNRMRRIIWPSGTA